MKTPFERQLGTTTYDVDYYNSEKHDKTNCN